MYAIPSLKKAPKQYLSELKNIYQDGLKEIVIEDPILYEETIAYLKMYQPEDLGKYIVMKILCFL